MNEAFGSGTLPGEKPGQHYKPTDVSNFGEILLAAYQIEMECVLRDGAMGWWPLGTIYPQYIPLEAALL